MAKRRQDLVGGPQIFVDRLGLGGRFHNDDIHVIPIAYAKNIRPVPRDSRPAVWTRTWVVRPSLSNRQKLNAAQTSRNTRIKSCISPPKVALTDPVFGSDPGHLERDLSKIGGARKRKGSGKGIPGSNAYGGGGPEEAAAFIAATAAELSLIAQRHGLDMLGHLLDMAQLEADDWLRNKRRLS